MINIKELLTLPRWFFIFSYECYRPSAIRNTCILSTILKEIGYTFRKGRHLPRLWISLWLVTQIPNNIFYFPFVQYIRAHSIFVTIKFRLTKFEEVVLKIFRFCVSKFKLSRCCHWWFHLKTKNKTIKLINTFLLLF